MAVAFTLPVLASVISFTIYGSVHGGLNAADVFASLALFQVTPLPFFRSSRLVSLLLIVLDSPLLSFFDFH